LADLEAAEYDDSLSGLWTRGLLVRRSVADGELAFFSTRCPAGTGIEALVAGRQTARDTPWPPSTPDPDNVPLPDN
jgi:SRSO17 transposase